MRNTINLTSTSRLMLATVLTAASFAGAASAQGLTLHVFGGSSLDTLAPNQTPAIQAEVRAAVFDGFLAEHPEVAAIDWDAQGPQADTVQRVLTARLAGQEMDLIACSANNTNGAYVRRGVVRAITEEIQPFVDNIEPSALNAFTIRGEVYGVPITTMSTSAIYYNKTIFADLGIPAPATYEELVAAVPRLEAAGIIPLLHQGANSPLWPMWYFETFSQTTEDVMGLATAQLDGEVPFNGPESVEAFALIRQWVDDGILSADSLAVDADGMRAAFASGRSAMYYGGTWEISSLQQQVTDFEWGAFAFPSMPGTVGTPKHGGGADNGICVSATIAPERLDAAIAFISYLTRPEVAAIYLEPESPLATSIVGVAGIDAQYALELRESAYPNTVKFLDWMWPSEVTTAVASAIAGVVGDQITPQQAADTVQAAFDRIVEDGAWPPTD